MAEHADEGGFAEEIEEIAEEESSTVMTTVVAGAAVALFAPELLPGMAIGVAAMIAPRILPSLGSALRPLIKTAVRAGYSTAVSTRELMAEAGEQMQDLVAEARAEQSDGTGKGGAHKRPRRTTKQSRAKR